MRFSDHINSIVESIIDPQRSQLDQIIFDGTDMRWGALQYFRNIAREINKIIDVKKAVIKGSILSYQWLENADIDILIEVSDQLKEEYVNQKYEEVAKIYNGLVYPRTNHPIQIYLHPGHYNENNADGIYDLDTGWVKGPYDLKVDIRKYLDDFNEVVSDLDETTGELKRNIIDYKIINGLPEADMIKMRSEIENKLFEINTNIDELLDQRDDIKKARKDAFSQDMTPVEIKEYGSKNALPDNVIFKLLERYHYIKFLDELSNISDDGIDKADITAIGSKI